MDLSKLIETEGMVEVADIGDYDYSWSELKVWYHPVNDRWYWLSDSGCSCNYYGDNGPYSLGDLEDGDRQAAIAALCNWGSSDSVAREMESVRDYKHEVTK